MKDPIHKRAIYQKKKKRLTWQNIMVKIKITEGIEEKYHSFFSVTGN